MNNRPSNVYLIGIGGIGMSALARYFQYQGARVSGYDKTPTPLTSQLIQEGMTIHFDDDIEQIDKQAELVIYTPAIPSTHKGLLYYKENGYQLKKRSQVLGDLSKDYFTIAVAGSHGKTTTSAMIAWMLKHSGYDCTAFLGGISINFASNFVAGDNKVMVVEADEFDRSFHTLHPNVAVVTAIDSDHLEIYGTREELVKNFVQFAGQVQNDGRLIHQSKLDCFDDLSLERWSYSLTDENADYTATHYTVDITGSRMHLKNGVEIQLSYPGIHNLENALAAIAVGTHLGIDATKIAAAMATFSGIRRRFEIAWRGKEMVLIDDYAHHPEEIRMFLKSVREIYPGKKITVVFQPHLFTRTRDLALDFAAALDQADETLLLPIYPAREAPIEGVESQMIAGKMRGNVRTLSKVELLDYVGSNTPEILCMVGAGDIDQEVFKVKSILENKK